MPSYEYDKNFRTAIIEKSPMQDGIAHLFENCGNGIEVACILSLSCCVVSYQLHPCSDHPDGIRKRVSFMFVRILELDDIRFQDEKLPAIPASRPDTNAFTGPSESVGLKNVFDF